MKWIMGCVTLVSYAVLVNGVPTDFFQVERGLRQGFPLYPMLFLLVIQSLSLMIRNKKEKGKIQGIILYPGLMSSPYDMSSTQGWIATNQLDLYAVMRDEWSVRIRCLQGSLIFPE